VIFYKYILIGAFIAVTLKLLCNRDLLKGLYLFTFLVILFEFPLVALSELLTDSNYLALNYYSKICIYYYLYVFLFYFKNKKWVKYYWMLFLVYLIITQALFIFNYSEDLLDTFSYNVGMILCLPLVLLYLYEIIAIKSMIHDYTYLLEFLFFMPLPSLSLILQTC
jgi:hypothetical protein